MESQVHSIPQRILESVRNFLNSYDPEYVPQHVSEAKLAKLFLKYKENIKELNLTNTFIDYDMVWLAKLIKSHGFTSVKLQHNKLTTEQALELVSLIKDVPYSICIDLSNNHLDDYFIESLMPYLRGRVYPMEIKVGHNITDDWGYLHDNLVIGDGVVLYDPNTSCNGFDFVEESWDDDFYTPSPTDSRAYYNFDFADAGSLNGEYEA